MNIVDDPEGLASNVAPLRSSTISSLPAELRMATDDVTDLICTTERSKPGEGVTPGTVNSRAVLEVLHFFNISNPSEHDILFLYVAQTHGFKATAKLAEALKWDCGAARRAIEKLMEGNGVAGSRHSVSARTASEAGERRSPKKE